MVLSLFGAIYKAKTQASNLKLPIAGNNCWFLNRREKTEKIEYNPPKPDLTPNITDNQVSSTEFKLASERSSGEL